MELHTAMSDREIIDLYWKRDERAIRETDFKYRKHLLTIANNILRDVCDSEECLSDTYIGAWNTIPPAKPAVLQSFLCTIMRRVAINRLRANKRQKRIVSEYTIALSDLENFITDDSDMEKAVQTKELSGIISDYARSLPERQMFIFVSRYYVAEPISTIGKELGCSVSTVKREIEAIKKGLKKRLEKEGYYL